MLSFHSPFEKNKMKFALLVKLHVLFMTVSLQVMTKRAEDLKRMWRRCLFSVGWPPSNLWGRCFIHWPTPQSIFSYWVGYDWIWIVRSVQTDLENLMLTVAVIDVYTYLLCAFSELTCHLENTGMGIFLLYCAAW